MEKEVVLNIVSGVMGILPSNRHSVTFDMYTDQSLTVYIHCTLDTNTFVTDSKSISSKEEYTQFMKWLKGWTMIIEAERDFYDAN